MNSGNYAIQIIPDLTIDDKYAAIIEHALNRINSFTSKALGDDRIGELYLLERSNLKLDVARQILSAQGRLVVGFQFEIRQDATDDNFRVYVKKMINENKNVKFYLTPTVQEIMLQLISLEDRRSVAIFSMLNSSMDIGYRILTTLYSNQLKRLKNRTSSFVKEGIKNKLDKLAVAKASEDAELWQEDKPPVPVSGQPQGSRPGSQDNLLMVLADDGTFDEINQYVGHIVSRSDRIREKETSWKEIPTCPGKKSMSKWFEKIWTNSRIAMRECTYILRLFIRIKIAGRRLKTGS